MTRALTRQKLTFAALMGLFMSFGLQLGACAGVEFQTAGTGGEELPDGNNDGEADAAQADALPDSSNEDAGLDVIEPDALPDSAPDVIEPDAKLDAPDDVAKDVLTDVLPDVTKDAPADSPADVSSDVVEVDAKPDAPPDATPDSSVDADASDADAGIVTCEPGDAGTPSDVTATGLTQTSGYAHFADGKEQYSNVSPSSLTLLGTKLPSQVVLSGLNGLTITFTGAAVPLYLVEADGLSECSGSGFYEKVCEMAVAKDFRCTYFPAEEKGCTVIKAKFTYLKDDSTYSVTKLGNNKILASVRCK